VADHDSMNASEAAGEMLSSAHADVLREAVRLMLIEIMEGEVAEFAGGERYERSAERLTQRNGYRPTVPTGPSTTWSRNASRAATLCCTRRATPFRRSRSRASLGSSH